MLSLLDLVDLDDLIGLKFDRLRWDLVGLGLLSDPEEAPEKICINIVELDFQISFFEIKYLTKTYFLVYKVLDFD